MEQRLKTRAEDLNIADILIKHSSSQGLLFGERERAFLLLQFQPAFDAIYPSAKLSMCSPKLRRGAFRCEKYQVDPNRDDSFAAKNAGSGKDLVLLKQV